MISRFRLVDRTVGNIRNVKLSACSVRTTVGSSVSANGNRASDSTDGTLRVIIDTHDDQSRSTERICVFEVDFVCAREVVRKKKVSPWDLRRRGYVYTQRSYTRGCCENAWGEKKKREHGSRETILKYCCCSTPNLERGGPFVSLAVYRFAYVRT